MAEIRLKLDQPHTGQQRIINRKNKRNVVCCGRRWGKSRLGIDRIAHAALAGHPTAWFAPNYKYLAAMWRRFKDVLKPVISKVSEKDYRIELITGGSIQMWTCDGSDPALGQFYACVVIDEAAIIPNLEHIWSNCIEPTLLDLDGDAWLLSTPRGFNYFKILFDRGDDKNPAFEDWSAFTAPTATNPTIRGIVKWVAKKKLTTDERTFSQEYLAAFINRSGSVFRYVSDAAVCPAQLVPFPNHNYVMGLDFGRTSDYTVVVVYDLTERCVAFVDRFTAQEFALQQARIQAIWERYRAQVMLCESNSFGQANIEALQRLGLPAVPFYTSETTKRWIIDNLALAFEQKAIRLLDLAAIGANNEPIGRIVHDEMIAYTGIQKPGGQIVYGAPTGLHDDTVIAHALAFQAAASGAGATYQNSSFG